MKLLSGFSSVVLLAVSCLSSSLSVAQDKPKAPMMKDAMMAKKMMMEPKTMTAAKMSMMGEKSMVPSMVAKEMMHLEGKDGGCQTAVATVCA